MMNLYLFNANDSAAIYGIGSYLRELTKSLEDSGMKIHIVHLHSVRPEFEIVKENQVEHWHIPEVRNQNTFSGTIKKLENYYHNVVYLLYLHIKNTKDLIFHFNYNQSFFLAQKLKSVFECRTVATVHFVKWMLELQGNLSRWHRLKLKPENQRTPFEELLYNTDEYEGLLYKEVDKVISLSKYTHNILCSEYQLNADKVTVIPNGLEDICSEIETEKDLLRRNLHIFGKEFIILFVGRLHAVKGLMFLIKAFRQVLASMPDCRLVIAGNGDFNSYMNECEDIWSHVSWTGLINKNKLFELYSIADIGVMPSFHEQCSYVAIEMMRHGLPIIGSTTTGLKEMILDGKTGLHIPVIEYDDKSEIDTTLLAEKMLYLLQHHEVRQRMGQNARKRYEDFYSTGKFRQNMLNFYRNQ